MPDPAPKSGAAQAMQGEEWCEQVKRMPPHDAWLDLWRRVGAGRHSAHHWVHREALLLRDVLALHHDLNPAALFYGGYPYATVELLARTYAHVPGDPMGRFRDQLDALQWAGWELLLIPALVLADPDRLVTWVPCHVVPTLFQRGEGAEHFPYIDFRPRDAGGQVRALEHRYSTPLLDIIQALHAMFVKSRQRGRYQEGDPASAPLVGNYLSKHHPELTASERALVLRAVKPAWWPDGRPGRRGRAFGAEVPDMPEDDWC